MTKREEYYESIGEKSVSPVVSELIQDTGTQLKWDAKDVYDKIGNILALAPAGEFSEIEALLLVVLINRLSKTKEGVVALQYIVGKYLDNMGRIISSMQAASASNWLTAAINQSACSAIYRRLGLISPADHYRNWLWIDHVFGEMLLKGYVEMTVGSLTTLISTSQEHVGKETESVAGLASLAKLFGGV